MKDYSTGCALETVGRLLTDCVILPEVGVWYWIVARSLASCCRFLSRSLSEILGDVLESILDGVQVEVPLNLGDGVQHVFENELGVLDILGATRKLFEDVLTECFALVPA